MTTRIVTLALAFAGATSNAQLPATVDSCEQLLAETIRTDLTIAFQDFDQSPTTGWRPLGDRKCFAEAAVLIRRYREANPSAHPVLRWHQSQMEAMAGQTESAIANAMATLRTANDDDTSAFRWNPYVLGTVAFLRRDRQALEAQHAELLRATAREAINAPNAATLARLKACFEKPYREAYSCTE